MLVYILKGKTYIKTIPVDLDLEKCVPCMGTFTEERIDPALWYKVLVLDSILLDCNQKAVYCSCERYVDTADYRCRTEQSDTEQLLAFFESQGKWIYMNACTFIENYVWFTGGRNSALVI